MNYYSLNRQSPNVNFKEATIKGQAPDKGLYFPETIPVLPKSFLGGDDVKGILKKENIGACLQEAYFLVLIVLLCVQT